MLEPAINTNDIAQLIEPGRIHRRVYTDPAIFDLEMERLFGRAWLFVGHESQIKKPGDFITTELGKYPVIMTRHDDGTVQVLINRCTHRGPKVVNEKCGHRKQLTCLYHGWTFDTAGKLLRVPVPEGCAPAFNTDKYNLAKVPRIGCYRGFVFASLAQAGLSFDEHIGAMKANIDDLVDRAPDGEIAFDAGMHRYLYRGNWKLQVENVLDSYHVPFSHASTVSRDGVQFARREGDEKGTKVVAEGGRTADEWKKRRSFTVGHGHGWTSNTALDEGKRASPAFNQYKAVLASKWVHHALSRFLHPSCTTR